MAQVRIHSLSSRCAEEHRAQQPETTWILNQQIPCVHWVDGLEHRGVFNEMHCAEDTDCNEPDCHDRAKRPADDGGAELLKEKQEDKDADNYRCSRYFRVVNS